MIFVSETKFFKNQIHQVFNILTKFFYTNTPIIY